MCGWIRWIQLPDDSLPRRRKRCRKCAAFLGWHLSREQKRQVIAESLKADPQLSNREHERRTGTHKNTVQAIREELESTAEIPQSETRVSGDDRGGL